MSKTSLKAKILLSLLAAGSISVYGFVNTVAAITVLTMNSTTSSSAVTAALFIMAAALRHATPIKTVFIRKAASAPVC
jgi:hypothetical protein